MSILIKNGHVIDPVNGIDGVFDILIETGKISKVSKNIIAKAERIIDAKGKIVAPGLIDMHVHLREPGREDIETVASGTSAAVSGGMTSICSMPNTYPAIDNAEALKRLKEIIKKDSLANVFIVAAITKGRNGAEITDMQAMKKEGAIAVSDDGNSVGDESVMSKAAKIAKENGLLLISHCENKNISKNGVVNEGITATKLGLRGIPRRAEYEFVERDINLAEKAKSKIHIAHVSTKESVEIIRKAKKKGISVTAETAPHYFVLDETACVTYDTRTKMNPPLRSPEDVEAVIQGLADGTIDAIASDHAPHGKHEKEIEFEFASFGIIGLETALPLGIMNLVDKKRISWTRLIELMSANPAKILGLKQKGSLSVGSDADITIIDPTEEWVVTRDSIRSKSKNSPFIGWKLKGLATDVIVGGKKVLCL
jgi:dihydroorotase